MLLKSKKNLIIAGACLTVLFVSSPKILAESKKTLEQIVMDHDAKIQQLQTSVSQLNQKVDQLSNTQGNQSEPISDEKQAILKKEYASIYNGLLTVDYNNPDVKMNIVDSKFVRKNGKNVFQLFFEGNYDWTSDTNGNWGSGRVLAFNLTSNFNTINKMYGVDADIEFYQNGQQIQVFAK